MNDELKGRRVIIVARCSTGEQAETSIEKQLELGRKFAKRNGMTVVDELPLPDKSATQREHVPHLRKLIERRLKVKDFDALYFLTISRFDRQRAEGDALFRDIERAGILIVSESQGTFTGKWGWIKRGMALQEAQSYVEDFAIHSLTGRLRLVQNKIIPHHNGFPYGIDRLFLDSHDVEQFILRKVSRTRIERLHPSTGEVLGVLEWDGKNRKGSMRLPGGKVRLIPGRTEHVEVVHRIMQLRHVEGWGAPRIAGLLNEEGVPAPHGGTWGASTIKQIMQNPVYTGSAISCAFARGRYVSGSKNGLEVYEMPREPAMLLEDSTTPCKHVPVLSRDMDEWVVIETAEMFTFLPESLREIVKAAQWASFKAREKKRHDGANVVGRQHGGDRHLNKEFFLTGILRSLQHDSRMSGTSNKNNGVRSRFYIASKGWQSLTRKKVLRRMVPAEPLEKAVLHAVQDVIAEGNVVQDLIRMEVMKAYQEAQSGRDRLQELRERKLQIEEQYRNVTDDMGPRGRELFKAKADQFERQLEELDQKIATILRSEFLTDEQVDETVEIVGKKVSHIHDLLKKGAIAGTNVHRLLRVLIQRLQIDLETKTAYLDVGLPSWSIHDPHSLVEGRLEDTRHRTNSLQPTSDGAMVFAHFQCNYGRKGRKPCITCHRKPRKSASETRAA